MRFTATLPALKGAARDTSSHPVRRRSGLDPTLVTAQLGNNVKTVLDTYAHLFDRGHHAAKVPDALAAGFGNLVENDRPRLGATLEVRKRRVEPI